MTGFWDKENNKLVETSTAGKLATGGIDLTQRSSVAMSDPYSISSTYYYMGEVDGVKYAVTSSAANSTLTYTIYSSTDDWENYSYFTEFSGAAERAEYLETEFNYGWRTPYDRITVDASGYWHWWLYESQDNGLTWTKKGNVPANLYGTASKPSPFWFTQSWTDGEFAYTICTGDDSDANWYLHCGVWRRQYDDNTWTCVIDPRANRGSMYWQSAPRYVGTYHLDGHSVDLCIMNIDDDDDCGYIGWYRDPDFTNEWKPISTAFYGSGFMCGYKSVVGKNQHFYLENTVETWNLNGAQVSEDTIIMCGECYGSDDNLNYHNCLGGMMVMKYNSTNSTWTVTRTMYDTGTTTSATYGTRPFYNIYEDDNYVYALRGLFWYGSYTMSSTIYQPKLWVAKKNESTLNWRLIYTGSQNQRMGGNWYYPNVHHYYINNYHIFVGYPNTTSSVPNVQLMVKDGVLYQNTLGQRIGVIPRDPVKDTLYKISDNVWLSRTVTQYSQSTQILLSQRPATIEGNKIYQMFNSTYSSPTALVYYTIDGGMKWNQLVLPTGGHYIDVDFSPLFGQVEDVEGDGLVTKSYLQAVLSYIVNTYIGG